MNKRIWMLLVAMAIVAVPSFGQQYEMLRPVDEVDSGGGWYDTAYESNGEYLDNPCTAIADWTWVNYDMFVAGEQTAANVDRYKFDSATNVSGSYSTSGNAHTDVAYAQPVEMRHYTKMPTNDQFHVVTVVSFHPYYQTTSLSLETACGNGMPDSLQ